MKGVFKPPDIFVLRCHLGARLHAVDPRSAFRAEATAGGWADGGADARVRHARWACARLRAVGTQAEDHDGILRVHSVLRLQGAAAITCQQQLVSSTSEAREALTKCKRRTSWCLRQPRAAPQSLNSARSTRNLHPHVIATLCTHPAYPPAERRATAPTPSRRRSSPSLCARGGCNGHCNGPHDRLLPSARAVNVTVNVTVRVDSPLGGEAVEEQGLRLARGGHQRLVHLQTEAVGSRWQMMADDGR